MNADAEPNGRPAEETLRTTDPLANKIFQQLRVRSIHERRFVLQALLSASRIKKIASTREQAMRNSLELYRHETGEVPSAGKYETWRKDQDDPGLHSASRLVRQFGSWNCALGALGLKEMADPTSLRLLSRGKRITDDHALQALRDCAAALGTEDFSLDEYTVWVKETLLDRKEPGPPMPIGRSTFVRRFGSIRQAKIEAGLVPAGAYHAVGSYTDDQILEALRRARKDVGEKLSCNAYSRWRKDQHAEALRQGRIEELPSAYTVGTRLGGWVTAVSLVGEIPMRSDSRTGCLVISAEWIAICLVDAYEEIGDSFYLPDYREWVKRHQGSNDFPPPGYYTVRRRLGSWSRIRSLVRDAATSGDLTNLRSACEVGDS